jgi:hypothetical protein
MFVIYGAYHWLPKRTGFRRDYCRRCAAERTAVLIRTLDVVHVFWIPLLPVGMWGRWFCGDCGHRPHASPRTRKGFKIVGAVILLLMTLLFWLAPLPAEDVEAPVLWTLRLGLPLALLGTLWSIRRHRIEPQFKRRLAQVRPHAGPDCLLCGGQLAVGTPTACASCGARHLPL